MNPEKLVPVQMGSDLGRELPVLAVGMVRINRIVSENLAKNDRGGYTVPTANLYPYQWNWDSVFAARLAGEAGEPLNDEA